MHWDVIIVGAGPAGAALACRLRPQFRVLLLERALQKPSALPRIGESLPGAARVLLQRLGVFEQFLHDQHAERGATISQWHSNESAWFDHVRDPNGPGWHLDRARFDARLRTAAVIAGAQLHEGCARLRVARVGCDWHVEFEAADVAQGGGQTHHASVLVDASGRSAVVARQLGIARRTPDALICLYAYLKAAPADQDQCTRLCAQANGWWYSARIPSGQRLLALHLDRDDPAHKRLRDPKQLLAAAQQMPLLANVLTGSAPELGASAVHVRAAGTAALDLDALATLAPGFFAVGDALLAFDPIASQGIFHALASAEAAAQGIEALLRGAPTPSAHYLAEMRAVQTRYQQHLRASYAQVERFASEPFWQRRTHAS